MRWGQVQLLYWLPLLIPLAWALFALLRRRRNALAQVVDPAMLPVLAPAWNSARAKQRLLLRILALGMLVIALARPQWGFHWEEVRRKGLDLMVVLDTSRSMMASDIKPSRLQQAKWGVRDLLRNAAPAQIAEVKALLSGERRPSGPRAVARKVQSAKRR